MAVTIPGAQLMLNNPVSTRRITTLKWILCHTIVGTVASALPSKHYHVYIRGDGTFIQRQDLLLRSAASVQANPYSIAIVAEDKGAHFQPWSGSNVPRYTPQQEATLVMILSWICHRFGLPKSAIATTCLNDRNGIGWHRLGIDGAFPNYWPLWGRRSGCLETSLSTGKPCPGDNRIWQIVNEIVPAMSSPIEEDDLTPEELQQGLHKFADTRLDTTEGALTWSEALGKYGNNGIPFMQRQLKAINDRLTAIEEQLGSE